MYRQLVISWVALTIPDVVAGKGAMWGACDVWDRDRSGCQMTSGHTCAAFLSSGPKDATYEIVLSHLPPSTADEDVHIQWFAPYEAANFDPMANVPKWKIYASPRIAYPTFTSEDFNGGNVRVNETGHAALRFKAPSTYYICRGLIRYPHIHIRLCHGDDYIIDRAETIDFTWQPNGQTGPIVRGGCRSKSGRFKIQSFKNIGVNSIPALSDPTTAVVDVTTLALTTEQPTTSKFLKVDGAPDIAANDDFDWDALEFSPVYQCLLEKKVFDLFGSGCVDACPSHSEEKHGQCVRKTTPMEVVFNVSWRLQVHCDEDCWDSKTSRTRHLLRLAAADHLDITFQEVMKVVLRPEMSSSRRLAGKTMTGATLHISVKTQRIGAANGKALLGDFVKKPSEASQILGLNVQSLEIVSAAAPEDDLQPAEEEDEFAAMYSQVEKDNARVSSTGLTDGLPSVVIGAGGAAVLVLGGLVSTWLWYKRRQMRMIVQGNPIIKAKEIDALDEKQIDGVVVGKEI